MDWVFIIFTVLSMSVLITAGFFYCQLLIIRLGSNHFTRGLSLGMRIGRKEQIEAYENIHHVEKELLYKNPLLICIGNEWDALDLVVFKRMDDKIPIVQSIVDGEEKLCFSILIPYTTTMLFALKKLNPLERYSLLSKRDIIDKEYRNPENVKRYENEPSYSEFILIALRHLNADEVTENDRS